MPEPGENPPWVLLRKQLLLFAALVVGVTYAAGINPPGGAWQENGAGHKAGDSILLATRRTRYNLFYSCNSTALAASVVTVFLLLLKKPRRGLQLVVLWLVMSLDLLGLVGGYATGGSRYWSYSTYFMALVFTIFACIFIIFVILSEEEVDDRAPLEIETKERGKLLMTLASFTAVITYFAGLSSSGGYWGRVESKYKEDDDALVGLDYKAKLRWRAFFWCNSIAFIASLYIVLLLLTKNAFCQAVHKLSVYILLASLLGLLGAYAAGTYRNLDTNAYVLCLVAAFLAYICCVIVMIITARWRRQASTGATTSSTQRGEEPEEEGGSVVIQLGSSSEESRKVKSLILLLAALSSTITYNAGLDPPGGVWPDDGRNGHTAGHPIHLSTHLWRYKVFFYCNSGAFVLSLAAILVLMVHKATKITTGLLVSVILGMVALVGAYAAGSWRNSRRSIYVIAMATSVIAYGMIYLLWVKRRRNRDMDYARLLKKRYKRLLLVATVVATITYQAGKTPPGGFRRQGDAAGAVLLLDNYPRHLWAFYFCNTVSYMAAMALVLLFVSHRLYRRASRCYAALYGCIVLALLGLMAANAAGTVRRVQSLQTYAYMFVLLVIVVSVISVHTILSCSFLLKKEVHHDEGVGNSVVAGPALRPRPRVRPVPRPRHRITSVHSEVYANHKHLMLLGILAASATYQAGLNPPGSLWQDDSNLGDTGYPVMYDRNRRRYLTFFYSNSTSFVVSAFVVVLQLQQILWKHQPNNTRRLVFATNVALVLDLLGLVAAYAAGTTWELGNAIALVVIVLFCLAIHVAPWVYTLFPVASTEGETKSLGASSIELGNL